VSAPEAVYFFDYFEVSDGVFGAVVRRAIERFDLAGTTGRIALDPAGVVEALVWRPSGQEILGRLYGLYNQASGSEPRSRWSSAEVIDISSP
jgi:hypothetical protein